MRTPKRTALMVAASFMFFVGFIIHSRQLFYMSVAAAVVWPLSLMLTRNKLKNLSARRRAPQTAQAGEITTVTLTLDNPTATQRLFVTVSDTIPQRAAGSPPHFTVPALGPETSIDLDYPLNTSLRGAYRLGPVILEASDTLGITSFAREIPIQDEVIVYPTPLPLAMLWPTSTCGRMPRRTARRRSHDGSEFFGIREYAQGDDPRRIHWPTTARMDDLMTIEFTREESFEGAILLDLYAGFHVGEGLFSSLEQGITLAATAANQAEQRGGQAQLLAIGANDYSVVPDTLGSTYRKVLEALARAETTHHDNWPDALLPKLATLRTRCPALVISPRTDRRGLDTAAHLLARQQQVSWIVLEYGGHSAHDFTAELSALGVRVRCLDCSRPLLGQLSGLMRAYA